MDATKSMLVLPTPDELNEIYRELGTSEHSVNADVKTIAEWMRKQPHLPDPEGKVRRTRRRLIVVILRVPVRGG